MVSSGSMSGSWVGSPSWITDGVAPDRVPAEEGFSSVTLPSLHASEGCEIYR